MNAHKFDIAIRQIDQLLRPMTEGQIAEVAKVALCMLPDQNSIPEMTWNHLDTLTDAEMIG